MSNDIIPCRSAELIVARTSEWSDGALERSGYFALPFADIMGMADRVMHSITMGLRTDVEWVSVDRHDTIVALRWQGGKKLELALSFSPYGFLASLYPDYVSHGNFQKLLVGWQAVRTTVPLSHGWPGGEPGAMNVHRLERSFHETGLTFDDPVFAGLPRVQAKHLPEHGEPTDLVGDIVEVTQNYLEELDV